ncbi:hypothetical protein M3Y98_00073800 [Aphelenchoides besseyi]|nr:hypothetical protein M3Y98_00073800 [Aphelenchoides besseyi]
MWNILPIVLLLSQVPFISSVLITTEQMKLIEKAKMDEKQVKRVHNMHVNWYIRAVNSLMGAVGREMFLKMTRVERAAFIRCLDAIEEEHDLEAGARCLVAAWDKELDYKAADGQQSNKRSNETVFLEAQTESKLKIRQLNHIKSIVVRHKPPTVTISPRLEKLKQRVNIIKPNAHATKYREKIRRSVRRRLKRSLKLHQLVIAVTVHFQLSFQETRDEYVNMFPSEFAPRKSNRPPDLIGTPKVEPKSFARQITNMFASVLHSVDANNSRLASWKQSYSHLKQLNEIMRTHREEFSYKHRMLDTVTDNDARYRKKLPFMKRMRQMQPDAENMPKMLKDTYELVDSMNKHTEMLNVKVLSPRFGSLIDDNRDQDTVHLLSPRLFSLYKDDSPNSILPLPDVVDAFGLRADDKDAVLELVMEASGANEIVKDAFNIFSTNETAQLMGDVDGVTETLNFIYDQVKSLFATRQRRDLAQRKYTFLNGKQLQMLYGDKGPYNNTLDIDIKDYAKWTEVDKRRALMNSIRRIASGEPVDMHANSNDSNRRKKRALTTLAPFAFAPGILAPAHLGPVTLSPNLFSPAIISPTILSPFSWG